MTVLDRTAWEAFARRGVAAALAHKSATEGLRAWVPGCSGGAPFGVALALLHQAQRLRLRGPIRVIGSDEDAEAVRLARLGRVARAVVESLPPAWGAAEHFEPAENGLLAARDSLRRHLVFSRHQLGWDPPFVQLDLVLVAGAASDGEALRDRLAEHLCFALRDDAVLWLADADLPVDVGRFERLPETSHGFRRLGLLARPELDTIVSEAVASERVRLGQELHDSVGQHVAAASLLAHRLRRRTGPREAELLGELERTLAAARSDLRAISRGQLPVEPNGSLPEALREMLAGLRRVLPARITASSDGDFDWIDGASARQLLRIAQESVRNAAAGGAKQVEVSLRHDGQGLRLEVRDDGPGLRSEGRSHEGLGLRIMRDRARMLGADLRFEVRDAGTSVVCALHREDCCPAGAGSHILA